MEETEYEGLGEENKDRCIGVGLQEVERGSLFQLFLFSNASYIFHVVLSVTSTLHTIMAQNPDGRSGPLVKYVHEVHADFGRFAGRAAGTRFSSLFSTILMMNKRMGMFSGFTQKL